MISRVPISAGIAAFYAAAGIMASIIQTTFGIPGVAGVAMIVVGPLIVVFSLNLFARFGGTLTMVFIYSIIVLPFHVLGTPGFFFKIIIALVAGTAAEVLFLAPWRKSKVWNSMIGGVYEIVVGYALVGLGLLYKLPEIDKLASIALKWWAIVPSFLISSIFGYFGYALYRRVEHSDLIQLVKKRIS